MAGPGPWDWLSLKVGLRKYSPPRSAQLHTHANTHRGMCTCRSTYSPSPGGFSVATAVCLLALAGGDKTERGEYGGRYGNRQIAVKGMLPWKRGQNMRKGTCALAHTSLMFSSPLFHFPSSAEYSRVWMYKTDNLKCDRWSRKATAECFSFLGEAVAQLHKVHQNADTCTCTRTHTP